MDPKTVEAVIAPAFLLIGLSHVFQAQAWVRFFDVVRATGVGSLIIPMFTLPVALVLIVGHNVWVWDWPVLLTIAGWGLTFKSTLYLLVPGVADMMLEKKMAKSPRSYQIAGAVMAIVGAILSWQAWA